MRPRFKRHYPATAQLFQGHPDDQSHRQRPSACARRRPRHALLWALREDLQLTGTKFGCGMALCGACTVHLDGQAVRSCSTPLSAAAVKKITTIEGLSTSKTGRTVQAAWTKNDVPQCGQIMSACALLESKKSPTDADIDGAMSGNICRCGTYNQVREAIHSAAVAPAPAKQGA